MTSRLGIAYETRLTELANALIDQTAARVIVPPQQAKEGFWFGGGNMAVDPLGDLYLVGRYRNQGDSRTGLGAGQRGLELAIFRSRDQGATFEKVLRFAKADLDVGQRRVLSIEGSALRFANTGVELFVSTEKSGVGYPAPLEDYQKPGAGVWTIERIAGDDLVGLREAPIETVLQCEDPRFLHVKDPFLYEGTSGEFFVLFCTHPYCWSSSNTAFAIGENDAGFSSPNFTFFPRGFTWDVAMTRGTAILDVPRCGLFADIHVSLIFYDGGECVRNLDEHSTAVSRPRGYSCEELGGLAYFVNGNISEIHRLSTVHPMFVSPHGSGCSRYVDVMATNAGYYATWQQSQSDRSQPLVMNFLPIEQVSAILTA